MNRTKIYTSIMLLVAFVVQAAGQSGQRGMYDFDFIKMSNPWLTSSNASGLRTLQTDRTSFVEVYLDKENGGLISWSFVIFILYGAKHEWSLFDESFIQSDKLRGEHG